MEEVTHTACRIKEYPRPQFVRNNWQNLNGQWDFLFDGENKGMENKYFAGFDTAEKINVPFAYQTEKSGIGVKTLCEHVWYQRKVNFENFRSGRVLLHFEGCDYVTEVWLNGVYCGKRQGGYRRLTFDVTAAAQEGENLLVVCATDDYSTEKPRGKQRWKSENFGCWYVDTTGIYKTVWTEYVPQTYIESVKLTPSVSTSSLSAEFCIAGYDDCTEKLQLRTDVFYGGTKAATATTNVTAPHCGQNVYLAAEMPLKLWETGKPELYDVTFTLLCGGKEEDVVKSYFGMREISVKEGRILLNGKPLYQKLILDQGYWQGSDLTPPCEEALEKDITDMIAMGFNGARKHQKVEDERFLYYADVYGYLVWAEMPSMYDFTEKSRGAFREEWMHAVIQQYNHPCIICWVPFNESWGVSDILFDKSQQDFVNLIYDDTKSYDSGRPVITNDGWEHTKSDILTIHHYEQDGEKLHSYFDTQDKCLLRKFGGHDKGATADGWSYRGQPVMITEFGGTAFVKDIEGDKWGYGESVKNDAEFLNRFSKLIEAIDGIPFMCGYCYTQLSDVHHEVNGLLEFSRKPKFDFQTIKEILGKSGR